MNKLFVFMEGPMGRLLRVALGLVLIYLGLIQIGGAGGWVLAVAGLLPIAMGLWGPCLANLAIHRFRRT